MVKVDLYNITPDELANLIKEGLKPEIQELIQQQLEAVPKGKEILSRQETADLFGISLVCLHDWMKKGIVKPYKKGNRTYFLHTELMESLLSSNHRA